MAGNLTEEIRAVCDKYSKTSGIRVAVRTRASQPMRGDPNPEPFRRVGCSRGNCLVCSTRGTVKIIAQGTELSARGARRIIKGNI